MECNLVVVVVVAALFHVSTRFDCFSFSQSVTPIEKKKDPPAVILTSVSNVVSYIERRHIYTQLSVFTPE